MLMHHNEWMKLTKSKALLIKLADEGEQCPDCTNALIEHLDIVWLQAGREITEEMQKYTQQWIEGHLELETANLNSVPRSTS
jgi:hypothetical protein